MRDIKERHWGAFGFRHREMRGGGHWGHHEHGFGGHRGFGEGGMPRGGGLRGGGRRRMFDTGELRLVLLLLMEAEPRHGYDIIRDLESRTGGAYAPSPGVVYPTLTLLEELGLVEAVTTEGSKRLFALTEAGRANLEQNRAMAEGALARLDALKQESGGLDSGPVQRAVQNLRAVLHQRLSGSPDKQVLFDAADILDEAARRIERL